MQEMTEREYVEARKATYTLLASLFASKAPLSTLEYLANNAESFEGAMGEYASSLVDADLERECVEAAAIFNKLLLNMSAVPVHPYESVYRGDKRLLMQEPRDEVVIAYGKEGFRVSEHMKLPEDHLSFEFEFMSLMCQKESDALEACDAVALASARESQRAFLRDHLLSWVPSLCDDMLVRTKTGLYAGLAEMTKSFLAYEAEEFELA